MSKRKTMFIRQRGTPLPNPNTFIGGVGATSVTSATDFAALTVSLTASNISNFQIDSDNNVSFFVDTTYIFSTAGFLDDTDITYFLDNDGQCVEIFNDQFRNCISLLLLELNGLADCQNSNFRLSDNIQSIYIPLLTPIGVNGTADQNNFTDGGYQFVYSHVTNETIDSGDPDPDLEATGIVTLDYIDNTTSPSAITNLAVDATYGEGFLIDWTAPSSSNAIGQYQIFVNGIYKGFSTGLSYAITGLTLNTNYDITVKTVDIFYNRSTSNTVNATTNSTYVIPTGDIVSYYPLNSNSDDSEGANDGVDTSITYVSGGIVSNTADFDSSNISIADDDTLSFAGVAFSISMWVKFDALGSMIIANKMGATTNREYLLHFVTNKFRWRLFSGGGTTVYKNIDFSISPTLDVWYFIVVTDDGSNNASGANMYIDTINVGSKSLTGSYTGMVAGNNYLMLGQYSGGSDILRLNGKMDEVALYDKELTINDIWEIFQKNNAGNGLTD